MFFIQIPTVLTFITVFICLVNSFNELCWFISALWSALWATGRPIRGRDTHVPSYCLRCLWCAPSTKHNTSYTNRGQWCTCKQHSQLPCTARCVDVLIYHIEGEKKSHHFAGEILQFILLYNNDCILIRISLKFVPNGLVHSKSAWVKITI